MLKFVAVAWERFVTGGVGWAYLFCSLVYFTGKKSVDSYYAVVHVNLLLECLKSLFFFLFLVAFDINATNFVCSLASEYFNQI